jgi:small-conductance mechanosensitive channel
MNQIGSQLGFLRPLNWGHVALVTAILIVGGLLVQLVRQIVRGTAESAPSRHRLLILRAAPMARLAIGIASLVIIVPILVEPTFEDILALVAAVGLTLAFALKDYVSCLIAGVVTILENTYQPGDWIEIDGAYGEVKTIGMRAVHIVTADDNEIVIPHAEFWSTSISNASSGKQGLLCVAHFYLNADHDGAAVSRVLSEVAETSSYRKSQTPIQVRAAETPFGTHYKLKAHIVESRQQFAMVTDLTLRAKERLRAIGVAFAQAPYAQAGHR